MRFIIAALLAAAAYVSCAPASFAADMPIKARVAPVPPPHVYDWSGFYLGGHFGYLWGRAHVEEGGVVTEDHASTNGVVGGVLAGYNFQSGPLVFGVEADFGWSHARGEGASIPALTTVTTQAPNSYLVNWTGHAHGRLGFAADNWLFYATGGLAVADFDFREGAITTTVVAVGTKYAGWSVGGGVEVALTRNLIGRVECLYDDYGHKDYAGQNGGTDRVSLAAQTLRGALAWKFDPVDLVR